MQIQLRYVDRDPTHLAIGVRCNEKLFEELSHEFTDLDFDFQVNDSDDDSVQFVFTDITELESAVKIIGVVNEEISQNEFLKIKPEKTGVYFITTAYGDCYQRLWSSYFQGWYDSNVISALFWRKLNEDEIIQPNLQRGLSYLLSRDL